MRRDAHVDDFQLLDGLIHLYCHRAIEPNTCNDDVWFPASLRKMTHTSVTSVTTFLWITSATRWRMRDSQVGMTHFSSCHWYFTVILVLFQRFRESLTIYIWQLFYSWGIWCVQKRHWQAHLTCLNWNFLWHFWRSASWTAFFFFSLFRQRRFSGTAAVLSSLPQSQYEQHQPVEHPEEQHWEGLV